MSIKYRYRIIREKCFPDHLFCMTISQKLKYILQDYEIHQIIIFEKLEPAHFCLKTINQLSKMVANFLSIDKSVNQFIVSALSFSVLLLHSYVELQILLVLSFPRSPVNCFFPELSNVSHVLHLHIVCSAVVDFRLFCQTTSSKVENELSRSIL